MTDKPSQTESEIIERVRSIDVRAPEQLHLRIEAMVAERVPARRRVAPTFRLGLAGALTAAAVAVALVLAVSGGGSGSTLTLHTAVALTQRAATLPAPARSPRNGALLAADVEGVAFPYWDDRFGWRSTGERTDRVDGRAVTTVFYAGSHGQWIGYAIVAGTPAPHVGGGAVSTLAGTPYRLTVEDGANVVTWQRKGRLCVVTGRGVSGATLLSLASWHGVGASPA
jgi:hypothetical protein